jgi:hypothetical protein
MRLTLLFALMLAALASGNGSVMAQVSPSCRGFLATITSTQPGATIHGTGGRDVIVATAGGQTVLAYGGDDLICTAGAGTVYAGGGDDDVFGNTSGTVYGSSGADRIETVAFADGGSGDDDLRHGDLCDGGSGVDTTTACAASVNVP